MLAGSVSCCLCYVGNTSRALPMNVSKYEGSTEEEGNSPQVQYSAIVRAVWSESKKDFKTPFGCLSRL